MKPVRTEGAVAKYFMIHECERCGAEARNIFGKNDNIEALLAIAKDVAEDIVKKGEEKLK